MAEKQNYNQINKPSEPEEMCQGCPQGDECRKVWSAAPRGPLTPTGLSLSSALVFLLPIATAIAAGAIVREITKGANHSTIAQALAAGGGLILGAFAAWLLMPVIKKRFYEHGNEKNHPGD
jgi:ABC-type nickel/cobalt efflux system permease component RcnA